jgi:hypothetical protein
MDAGAMQFILLKKKFLSSSLAFSKSLWSQTLQPLHCFKEKIKNEQLLELSLNLTIRTLFYCIAPSEAK